ncbi:MAG: SWIM zinc finger family protein [Methanosarcinales archaeon]
MVAICPLYACTEAMVSVSDGSWWVSELLWEFGVYELTKPLNVPAKLYALTDRARIERAFSIDLTVEEIPGGRMGYAQGRENTYIPKIMLDGRYICTCEDYIMRKSFCKHLVALFFTFSREEQIALLPNLISYRRFDLAKRMGRSV